MLFALVLFMNVNGQSHAYVMDYNLTKQDCLHMLSTNKELAKSGKLQCRAQ